MTVLVVATAPMEVNVLVVALLIAQTTLSPGSAPVTVLASTVELASSKSSEPALSNARLVPPEPTASVVGAAVPVRLPDRVVAFTVVAFSVVIAAESHLWVAVPSVCVSVTVGMML